MLSKAEALQSPQHECSYYIKIIWAGMPANILQVKKSLAFGKSRRRGKDQMNLYTARELAFGTKEKTGSGLNTPVRRKKIGSRHSSCQF